MFRRPINPIILVMERNIRGKREFIGQGHEHKAYRSLRQPNHVFKVPRLYSHITLLGENASKVLREEINESRQIIEQTDVEIPRTIIVRMRRKALGLIPIDTYVMGQEFIEDDSSVENISEYLLDQGLESLLTNYKPRPSNFISREGTVYWIDPTRGRGRLLERLGIMKVSTYRKTLRSFRKTLQKFQR